MSYWDKMTPEQRSAEMKRRSKKGRRNGKKKKHYQCKHCGEVFETQYKMANHVRYKHTKTGAIVYGAAQSTEAQVAYAFGHCEAWLANFSERVGLSRQDVARRVGQLLQR